MTARPLRHAGSPPEGMAWRWLAPVMEMAAAASGNSPLSPGPGPLGWTCHPRVATRTPSADAGSMRAARGFTIATLQRWGATGRAEDIALIVSELLTNALRHALPGPGEPRPRWPVRLGLLQPGPCVLCAVADPSQQPPVVKESCHLAETGRGLHVIGALADAWGYTTPCDTGKVVWAMVSTEPAAPLMNMSWPPCPAAARSRHAGYRPAQPQSVLLCTAPAHFQHLDTGAPNGGSRSLSDRGQ